MCGSSQIFETAGQKPDSVQGHLEAESIELDRVNISR